MLVVASNLSTVKVNVVASLIEHERMEEYHRRGHKWPPTPEEYKPNTPGWSKLNDAIFQQLQFTAEESPGERYEGFMSAVHRALVSKNFTEYGWGITRAPRVVVDKLKNTLHDGMKKREIQHENEDVCLETDLLPYFIPNNFMNQEVLHDLLPLHEAWSGVELVPYYAYGLRVYRNDSNLLMHVDKKDTHVISSILHIDHGVNDEPWPLVIEDFHGNTNEVFLESGDMLFYESSKCRHGRPKKFNGEYYSSLFSHYYPKTDWDTDAQNLDIHYRIPEKDIWVKSGEGKENDNIDEMSLISLCMKEPNCEHEWCRLNDTLKWYGPGPGYGKVLSGGGVISTLASIPSEESFEIYKDEL